jgi:hypothetical protein
MKGIDRMRVLVADGEESLPLLSHPAESSRSEPRYVMT